jgi:hypothetical protein
VFGASQTESATRSPAPRELAADSRIAGGSVALDGALSYDQWSAHLRAGSNASTVKFRPVENIAVTSGREVGFADGGITWTQRGLGSSTSEALGGTLEAGRSFGTGFTRETATASFATTATPILPVVIAALYGRTNAGAPAFERFTIGGGASPLFDRTVLEQRVAMPALPAGLAGNTSVFVYKGTINSKPLSLYWWSASSAPAGTRFGPWHRVVGAEWTDATGPIGIVGTPAARAAVGVGESLDDPFKHRMRAYITFILNP